MLNLYFERSEKRARGRENISRAFCDINNAKQVIYDRDTYTPLNDTSHAFNN